MSDKKEMPRKNVETFKERERFTEEVHEENGRLRLLLEGQKNRAAELEEKADKEMPGLRQRVQLLEEENLLLKEELKDVKKQFNEIEKENWSFSERYLHVERQNTSLLNLFVASQRLHSTISFPEAIQIVKELVVNLIGSEAFDVCLFDEDSGELLVLATLGTASKVGHVLGANRRVRDALASGNVTIPDQPEKQPDGQTVVACVPLKLRGTVLGAIIIRGLLAQKFGIDGADYELFDMLGEHAVSALCASYLFSKAKILDGSGDWKKTCTDMSREAQGLEGTDVEPTVVW